MQEGGGGLGAGLGAGLLQLGGPCTKDFCDYLLVQPIHVCHVSALLLLVRAGGGVSEHLRLSDSAVTSGSVLS